MLRPGAVATRPPTGKSQAHAGVAPLSELTTAQAFQPLPRPLGPPPYHYDLETAVPGIGQLAATQGQIVFHTVGDTGGIKSAEYQANVAAAMKSDLTLGPTRAPS